LKIISSNVSDSNDWTEHFKTVERWDREDDSGSTWAENVSVSCWPFLYWNDMLDDYDFHAMLLEKRFTPWGASKIINHLFGNQLYRLKHTVLTSNPECYVPFANRVSLSGEYSACKPLKIHFDTFVANLGDVYCIELNPFKKVNLSD